MQRDIIVVAEHGAGQLEPITLQMISKGRELADALQEQLVVLALGHQLAPIAASLQHKGADKILLVENPVLERAGADLQACVIAEVIRRTSARVALIGYSLVGMELAPAIATELGAVALTNCVNAEYLDHELVVTRPMFDGLLHARIAVEPGALAIVGIQGGVFAAAELSPREARVEEMSLDLQNMPARCRLVDVFAESAGDIDIGKADVVVSVGRGIREKEKIRVIEELADALGGVVACSRPIVDVGWLPRERQVGASGRSVTPKVYIACGISGASQHISGMSASRRIIAINNDANAPIFQIAHFGVVANLFDILPALTDEAKKSQA